jgi:murein DD-endopeptidase MepM/ murein hydrolase activator NlpD
MGTRLRIMVACAMLALLAWTLVPLGSQAAPAGRLSSLQRKLEVTGQKLARKRGTARVLSGDIASYSRRINRLQSRISSLHRRELVLQEDLDAKRAELARIQEELRQQRARLARLRTRLAVARRALAARLVELYKADTPDIVTVVLSSRGFADLLERGEFLRRISEADRKIVLVVRTAKQDATRTAKRLTVLERRQQRVTAVILARRNEIAGVRRQLVGTRAGYAKTRAGKQRALAATRASVADLARHYDKLQAEQARVAAALRSAQGAPGRLPAGPIRGGSGQFIWPVNGPITGQFGEFRGDHNHAGIDISAPGGTPIRAAGSGRVVLLGWTGGYGNYTCINHGGALATCYAHQSGYATSRGASVRQGQVIGYVGNTGYSFGNHLHFEVRINGTPVNPLNYL